MGWGLQGVDQLDIFPTNQAAFESESLCCGGYTAIYSRGKLGRSQPAGRRACGPKGQLRGVAWLLGPGPARSSRVTVGLLCLFPPLRGPVSIRVSHSEASVFTDGPSLHESPRLLTPGQQRGTSSKCPGAVMLGVGEGAGPSRLTSPRVPTATP